MGRGAGQRVWLRAELGGHPLDFHLKRNSRSSSSVVRYQERGLIVALVITIISTLSPKYRLVSWMLC